MLGLVWKVIWNVSMVLGVVVPLTIAFLLITRKPQVEAWWNGADAYSQFKEGEAKERVNARLDQLIEAAKAQDTSGTTPKPDDLEEHFITDDGEGA